MFNCGMASRGVRHLLLAQRNFKKWMHPTWTHISSMSAISSFFLRARHYSRMRSKGSRFTLGVWGLRVCSLDVAFVVATVRNRSQPFARLLYGRAYGKFCNGGHFWRFQTCRCFVSRGRRGTSWHSDVFCNVSKVVLCWQAQYFCDVFRRCVAVFVAGAALWTCPSSFCVAGAAL